MKPLRERRKDRLRRFTQNSLKGKGHWISYIYYERLNLLLRKVNDLTTTIGMRREKSKAGTLSKRLEKPHCHSEQNLHLQLYALKNVGCQRRMTFGYSQDRTSSWRTEEPMAEDLSFDFERLA